MMRQIEKAQGKERQGARSDLGNIVEKIPQCKARDEAGKAAAEDAGI